MTRFKQFQFDSRDRFDNGERPKINDAGFSAHLSARSYL